MDPENSTFKFTITALPSKLKPNQLEKIKDERKIIKNDLETGEFLKSLNQEGYVYFTDKEINDLKKKGVIPENFNSEKANDLLNVSVQAFSLGMNGAKIDEAVDKSVLEDLEQKEYVHNVANTVSHFAENNPMLAHNFEVLNSYPEVVIESASLKQDLQANQILLGIRDNAVTPIFEKVKSSAVTKIKGLISTKGKKESKKALEKIAKKTGSKAVKKALKIGGKAAGKGLKHGAVAAVSAATGVAAPIVAPLLEALQLLVSKVVNKVIKYLKENKEAAIAATAMGAGALFGSPLLLWSGVAIFSLYIGTAIVVAIVTPILGGVLTLLGIILTMIFAFQIIFRGGFVVPDFDVYNPFSAYGVTLENPYIGVGKVANPTQANSPRSITYTITVIARREVLSNIHVSSYTCQAIKEGGVTLNCPSVSFTIPTDAIATTDQAYTFEYTVNYSGSYQDSLVTDTITITADTPTESGVSGSASASVCFGNCPSDCYQLDNSWTGYRGDIEAAVAYLVSNYSPFTQKVCAANPQGIILHYGGSNGTFWGFFHPGSPVVLDFYSRGFTNDGSIYDTVYILAHESGHALAYGNPSIYQEYLAWPGISSEIPRCFYDYGYTGWDYSERFPEAIAFYTISNWRCSDWASTYPRHYDFVNQNIFR